MTEESSQAVARFAAIAGEYCEFFERWPTLSADDLLRGVHRRFALIYAAGLELPNVFVLSDGDDGGEDESPWSESEPFEIDSGPALPDDPDALPAGEWLRHFRAMEKHLGPRKTYRKVFDPYDMDGKDDHGFLADDICDVYRDLRHGLVKWRRGEPDTAAHNWQWSFASHTGDHILWALRALHSLAFELEGGLGVTDAPRFSNEP